MTSFAQRVAAVALGLVAFIGAALAQPYPNRVIRIITPFSTRSGPDSVLRLVAEKIAKDHEYRDPSLRSR
jgi:tripartite-type tricarboxylate transporter receptor subunit TctC